MRKAVYVPDVPGGPADYSQVVVAGNLVFVAGTVGKDMATDTWPTGVAGQMDQALKNLAKILAAAGCGLDDVVKITTFITPGYIGADGAERHKADELFDQAFAEPRPAQSAPIVALPVPEALISIEAIAVKPNA